MEIYLAGATTSYLDIMEKIKPPYLLLSYYDKLTGLVKKGLKQKNLDDLVKDSITKLDSFRMIWGDSLLKILVDSGAFSFFMKYPEWSSRSMSVSRFRSLS